jgi:CRP-like cAMP-binding protein
MISPELLRRYRFFGPLDDAQLKAIAMISDETAPAPGGTLLENEQPAQALYLLIEGSVELWYVAADKHEQGLRKEFYIGDVNPGEVFGISALIEPYHYTSTVRAKNGCRVIRIDAAALRALCEVDTRLSYSLIRQIASAAIERLQDTRVQLLAARA